MRERDLLNEIASNPLIHRRLARFVQACIVIDYYVLDYFLPVRVGTKYDIGGIELCENNKFSPRALALLRLGYSRGINSTFNRQPATRNLTLLRLLLLSEK